MKSGYLNLEFDKTWSKMLQLLFLVQWRFTLDANLTYYASRHSWETIGKRSGVQIAIISEGLGHSDLQVSEIYLYSFDIDVLDDCNEIITG